MTAIFFIALIGMLLALLVRWISSAPLVRTLSIAIDTWADGVQGEGVEHLR
ncbi:MAG TPA: hypothetical protein VD768_08210 [Sphingomicrobium sp.]|nr:hypothetical protein [Sphingomicrobium sp.]